MKQNINSVGLKMTNEIQISNVKLCHWNFNVELTFEILNLALNR